MSWLLGDAKKKYSCALMSSYTPRLRVDSCGSSYKHSHSRFIHQDANENPQDLPTDTFLSSCKYFREAEPEEKVNNVIGQRTTHHTVGDKTGRNNRRCPDSLSNILAKEGSLFFFKWQTLVGNIKELSNVRSMNL